MHLIYLSPHLDDAVYSCGGHIWQQQQAGYQVEIWTLFAGDPPGELTPFAKELHARWGTGLDAALRRRAEDRAACQLLGVSFRHFESPDCIYRRIPSTGEPVITANEDLFQPVSEGELPLARSIARMLQELNPQASLMAVPLAVGGHVDHRLTRMAAEFSGLPLAFYADFPYSRGGNPDLVADLPKEFRQARFELSPEAVNLWAQAVAAYQSQLSSFWESEEQMREEIAEYSRNSAGSGWWLPIAYSQTL